MVGSDRLVTGTGFGGDRALIALFNAPAIKRVYESAGSVCFGPEFSIAALQLFTKSKSYTSAPRRLCVEISLMASGFGDLVDDVLNDFSVKSCALPTIGQNSTYFFQGFS